MFHVKWLVHHQSPPFFGCPVEDEDFHHRRAAGTSPDSHGLQSRWQCPGAPGRSQGSVLSPGIDDQSAMMMMMMMVIITMIMIWLLQYGNIMIKSIWSEFGGLQP